jgi:primosomal protein N' (replication factor Y)
MDEEQESSYKQDQTPRYHARDVARWRMQQLGGTLLLGSATPSVETIYQARAGKVVQLELPERIGAKKLPTIDIVDLRRLMESRKENLILSPRLRDAIQENLDRREGTLLLLNRRGFSTQVQCLKCGEALMCRHCDVALTFHQKEGKLLCHYCNYQTVEPSNCVRCGSHIFHFHGVGTEKVESETAKCFPLARIARLDSDTARRRGSMESILADFRSRATDILVGTQMIAKGFDIPHVTLVGVILADTALVLPDFRSSEKTFQLLTQAAGRSGRGEREGRVIIQTFLPEHYSVEFVRRHLAASFYDHEIKNRREVEYPPFVRLINIMVRGKLEARVMEQARLLSTALREQMPRPMGEILGPAPLPFRKLHGQFRWHVMVKDKESGHAMTSLLRKCLSSVKKLSRIHVAVDMDPVAIL